MRQAVALRDVVERSCWTPVRERFSLAFQTVVSLGTGDGSGRVDRTIETLRTDATRVTSRLVVVLAGRARSWLTRPHFAEGTGRTLIAVRLAHRIGLV